MVSYSREWRQAVCSGCAGFVEDQLSCGRRGRSPSIGSDEADRWCSRWIQGDRVQSLLSRCHEPGSSNHGTCTRPDKAVDKLLGILERPVFLGRYRRGDRGTMKRNANDTQIARVN